MLWRARRKLKPPIILSNNTFPASNAQFNHALVMNTCNLAWLSRKANLRCGLLETRGTGMLPYGLFSYVSFC